jgi:hypothetical protein
MIRKKEVIKKKEKSLLSEIINAVGIAKSLEELQKALDIYAKSALVKNERYLVAQEFRALQNSIELINDQLREVISQSKEWEVD